MPELKRIPREKTFGEPHHYVLDKNTPPIVEVEPGERIVCEIEDSLNGVLRDRPDRLYPRDAEPASTMVPAWINPLCGPIYIKSVEPGDVMVVNIEKIEKILNGVIITVPGWHHFAGLRGWEECDEMYTGIIENKDGNATWQYEAHTHTWELKPFLGTIATAPEFEVLSTLATSFGSALAGGGNLDCRDVRAGVKVYLQSFNEGGLLSFGDPHASQGDGEICSVANEAAAEVTLSCDVIKNKTLNNVRLETPESLISVYCYRPVEEAIRQAMKDLILWLEEDYGMTKREVYLLSSVCPGFRINIYQCCGNLGRLMTTVGAELPKNMIPK
jgi:acetamidase/formamidase